MKETLTALALVTLAVHADRTIFITPSSPQHLTNPAPHPCLQDGFYGRYGRRLKDVYIVPSSCAIEAAAMQNSGSMAYLSNDDDMPLVWLEEAVVEDSLRRTEKESFWLRMTTLTANLNEECRKHPLENVQRDQLVMSSDNTPSTHQEYSTLYFLNPTSALISVPASRLPIIDTYLPRFVNPTILPSNPLGNIPIDPHAVKRLQHTLSNLQFNPTIASVLSGLNVESMRKDIRWLTMENEESGILSRHSFTSGAKVAADYIQGEIEKSGAVCEQQEFASGFAPNVICRYPSTVNTTATTILSAHYDSRGSFGSLRAPGGDDDGSGTTHVLAVARLIKEKHIAFKSRFELVLFAGEEQGLVGSRAYSRALRDANANITLHIQADMLAYHAPDEPLQMGLPEFIGLPEAAFLVANVSKIYAPELTVGYTAACCSDHQSFHEQGFPATQVFERAGPIIDPMYHNSGDISNRTGYDLAQLLAITKVTFASILEITGFEIVPVQNE